MKNHKAKHQVEKAVRQAKKTHPLPHQKTSSLNKQAEVAKAHNKIRRYEDHLKLENSKISLEMLKLFKKHLEHSRTAAKPHQSKRTAPGVLEREGPFNQFHSQFGYSTHTRDLLGMAKSQSIGRKFLKNQNYKKAA